MDKNVTISDVINELKRLQVEHGNLPTIVHDDEKVFPAWPQYNEENNVIEF